MNVFGNALKYTQKGSITVKLALDPLSNRLLEDTERMLEISVIDTGKGISSEYLRTSLYNRGLPIYRQFSKLADLPQLSAKKTYWQAGLGLAYLL